MKRLFIFAVFVLVYYTVNAQRVSGYGRGGYDDGSPDFGGTTQSITFFLVIGSIVLILGVIAFIVGKVKEKEGLKSGDMVKIVSNGYIVSAPKNTNDHLEVVKTWKLLSFEQEFGKAEYILKKINRFESNVSEIKCGNIIVYVRFDCNYGDFINRYSIQPDKYEVAQVRNGGYLLIRK